MISAFLNWIRKLFTKEIPVATIADLVTEAQALQGLSDDQTAKSNASHAAADNVATVTSTQGALVAKAQADADVAINAAQAASDAAKSDTDASTAKLNAAIQQIITDAQSLSVK